MRVLTFTLTLTFLALFSTSVLAQVPGCEQQGLDADTYNALMTNLTNAFSELDAEELFQNFIEASHAGFSGKQIVGLLNHFNNSLIAIEVVEMLAPYSLDLTCEDVRTILNQFASELDALDVLAPLAPLLIDTRANNETILSYFGNTFNREDAEKLLIKYPQASCVFGPGVTKVPRIAFVVDTSGSMSTLFPYNGGSIARLAYVQQQLDQVVKESLSSSQAFNLIQFSSSAYAWAQGVQPVTQSNVDSGVAWVNSLTAGGSTAMLKGLQLAFSDDDVLAVFLLTDGEPDGSRSAIIDAAQAWAGSDKAVNTIAFTAGGSPDPASGAFMKQLAESANGVYRVITG